MDDDEEVHSHTTGSSSSSPPNGRITVSVAAAMESTPPPLALPAPPSSAQQNSSGIGLPAQQSKAANGGGWGREDCWSEGATEVLIDAWGERYLELNRGNLKQKHWKEVADVVSSREDYTKVPKTDIQCKNRIDTVKKKYKVEKARVAAGGGRSTWRFFEKLDSLIGPTSKVPLPVAFTSGGGAGTSGRVPFGIPVGRGVQPGYREGLVKRERTHRKMQARKRGRFKDDDDDDDEEEEEEGYSDDSLPPPPREKRPRVSALGARVERKGGGNKDRKGWGSSIRVLTQAILKFGEAYEQAESAKLQHVVEMEKIRMKFAKELELQRMQFFMNTQMEISQLKHGRRGGSSSSNHHPRQNQQHLHSGNHVNNSNNHNNSDGDD